MAWFLLNALAGLARPSFHAAIVVSQVLSALFAQAAQVIAVGLPTETEVELAELLCLDALRIWRAKFGSTNLLFARGKH